MAKHCVDCGGVTPEYVESVPKDLAAKLRASKDLDLRIRVTMALIDDENETLRALAERVPPPPGTAELTRRIRAAGANRPGVFERGGANRTGVANRTGDYTTRDEHARAEYNEKLLRDVRARAALIK
jgi:hypothetical protein